MTIKEYIERRGMAIRYLGILWIVAILLAVFVFPERFANFDRRHLGYCAIPITLLYWFLASTTKCPRCRTSLADMTWRVANPFASEFPDECPSCHVKFEEPMKIGS